MPSSPGSINVGYTDHGNLNGLGDDDHTQYPYFTTGTGSPVGAVTPQRVGHIYVATDLENAWIATNTTNADWEQLDAAGGGGGPSVSTGAGAPVSTPSAEGDIYIDTTNDVSYMAVGTASSGDWKQTSNLPQGLTSVSQDTNPTLGGNLDGGGFTITNIGTVDGRDVSADGAQLDDYLSQGIGTGVRNGGLLTVNGGDGTGYIVDCYTTPGTPTVTEVSWTGKTAITITNLATNLITFVSIDSGGNVIQRTSRWTPAQSRDEIVLGVVVHVNKTNADTTNDEQHTSLDAISQVYDLCEGLGFFNIDGNEFSADGANLFLQKADGNMFARGAN
jgi:hypothetical protein